MNNKIVPIKIKALQEIFKIPHTLDGGSLLFKSNNKIELGVVLRLAGTKIEAVVDGEDFIYRKSDEESYYIPQEIIDQVYKTFECKLKSIDDLFKDSDVGFMVPMITPGIVHESDEIIMTEELIRVAAYAGKVNVGITESGDMVVLNVEFPEQTEINTEIDLDELAEEAKGYSISPWMIDTLFTVKYNLFKNAFNSEDPEELIFLKTQGTNTVIFSDNFKGIYISNEKYYDPVLVQISTDMLKELVENNEIVKKNTRNVELYETIFAIYLNSEVLKAMKDTI